MTPLQRLYRRRTGPLGALLLFAAAGCSGTIEGKDYSPATPSEDGSTAERDATVNTGSDGSHDAGTETPTPAEGGTDASVAESDAQIAAVWLAQTHVQKPDDPLFKLVGNRAALLKVDVVSESEGEAPKVQAQLTLGNERRTVVLTGPATLPATLPSEPGVVVHRYEDSFTAVVPAEWVRAGLRVQVQAGSSSLEVAPRVGAPTVVPMTMFDVHYFGAGVGGDYPVGGLQELAAKWPVAEVRVQRVQNLLFDTLVIPPRDGAGAARVASREEYTQKTGLPFDGEQGAALRWVAALRDAGGQSDLTLCYVNIYGVGAGGQAGGFQGVGNGTALGILHHELGHALSLPHWGDNAAYPYRGDMFGIAAPDQGTHVGPTWAFDPPSGNFLPPIVQPVNVGGRAPGTFKADPMQGGGTGDQEPGFLLRHFSDYSVDRMRSYLESKVSVWNAELNSYARWSDATGSYSSPRANNGVSYPLAHDVQVISVMASTSLADLDVNLVYPPIGPYRSGLIRTFDPTKEADRTSAASIYCPSTGCDYSLRIVQGGVTRTLMLRASGAVGDDPLNGASLGTGAVNLRAADGKVTQVELLSTPDVEDVGMPATPSVLARWPAP